MQTEFAGFFELRAVKGAAILTCWGIALDFVPHIASGSLKWHRTFASAIPDLWIETCIQADELSYLRGKQHLSEQVPHALDRAFMQAKAFWAFAAHLDDLPEVFRTVTAQRDGMERLTSAEMLPQIRLAEAFVLARVGRVHDAQERLNAFVAQFGHQALADDLKQRLDSICD